MIPFFRLSAPFWGGATAIRAWGLTLAIMLFGLLQVVLAVRLNLWSADMFDALERRSGEGSATQLAIFAAIVAATMVVNASHLHVKRGLQLSWRRWLTERLTGEWMHDGNQFRLDVAAGTVTNPDGRIAEDIRIATEAAVDVAHSLFYCSLLLISFVGILWGLSGEVTIDIADIAIVIPGHMVWLTFLYAGGGSVMAMYIGRRLISAADHRQTMEANLRYALMRGRDNAESVALAHGEANERRTYARMFAMVAEAWQIQTDGLRRLILFSSAYGTLAGFFPILVSSPRFLSGAITLGGLMQIAQAFQQATAALSWPVDNFPRLAELRASVERVMALHLALTDLSDRPVDAARQIEYVPSTGAALIARGLVIEEPDGMPISTPFDLEIVSGERVLLSGDTRTITVLCKVISGVWRWGSGTIDLPDKPIYVAAEHPYMPSGTLRQAITYHASDTAAVDRDPGESLADAGLDRLLPRLDESDDWALSLRADEIQRLGFARLLYHRPGWILLDRAASTLDEIAEQEIMNRLVERIPGATILAADPRPRNDDLFNRSLVIERVNGLTVSSESSSPIVTTSATPSPKAQSGIERLLHWVRAGYGGDHH